jgi:hypothetical protein
MKKTTLKYIIDILLFVSLLGIVLIGLLLAFAMAKGPAADESAKYFLNLHRHQWGDIHLYMSLAFSALAVFHLVLSWSWIKGKTKQLFQQRWRQVLFIISAAGFAVILLFWIFTPKYPGSYENYGRGMGASSLQNPARAVPASEESESISPARQGDTPVYTITGTMTLQEISKQTGLSVSDILDATGLPGNVSPKETLGWLKKKHGFTLVEFRAALEGLITRGSSPAESPPVSADIVEEKVESRQANPPADPEPRHAQSAPLHEEHEEKLTRGRLSEEAEGVLITGQNTFRDIQRISGIDIKVLLKQMNLPQNIPMNERLGRLRRIYGFTLQDVRDTVARLLAEKPPAVLP